MVKAKSPNFLSALAYRFLPAFLHCLSDISVAHTDQYASECEKVITLAYFDTVAFGSIHVCSLRKTTCCESDDARKRFLIASSIYSDSFAVNIAALLKCYSERKKKKKEIYIK